MSKAKSGTKRVTEKNNTQKKEEDENTEVEVASEKNDPSTTILENNFLDETTKFADLSLDNRLSKAISSLGFIYPTKIQASSIKCVLQGRDVCVNARTGSGKTLSYAIPVIQAILISKKNSSNQAVQALILVPTNELCDQVHTIFKSLLKFCGNVISIASMASEKSININTQAHTLKSKPGTLGRISDHVSLGNIKFDDNFKQLVLDEADLLLSVNSSADLSTLTSALPTHQTILMSATLSDEVTLFNSEFLRRPQYISLPDAVNDKLQQFYTICKEDDKFLLVYALLKLGSIKGKTLFFVHSVDKCYKLKLFFETFSIRTAVLNPELPQNTRYSILDQFHRGLFDHLIATDESVEVDNKSGEALQAIETKNFGVARGIDFKFVSTLVNFDTPTTANSYIHRIGRTARGGISGVALSLITDENIISEWDALGKKEISLSPLQVKWNEIDGFRYRVENSLRAITGAQVKDARLRELKLELLNSAKLKNHFDEHPNEKSLLAHDKILKPHESQPNLAFLPSYLMPNTVKSVPNLTPSFDYSAGHAPSFDNKKKRMNNSDPLKHFGKKGKFNGKRR